MSQDLILKLNGIKSYPSPITAPPGSLEIASNVVMTREDTVESRRGFNKYLNLLSGTINNIFEFKDILYLAYNSKLAKDTGAVWTDLTGALVPVNSYRIRSAQQNLNLYLNSNNGIKKVDITNNAVINAGVPQGVPLEGLLTANASGFFLIDNQTAYRVVWTITDENKNLLIGSPSARLILTNPAVGAISNVSLTIGIPVGITTAYKYQLYRATLSGSETTPPDDEMQLVREESPTAGQITAGEVVYIDDVQDGNRGVFLYTSPSIEGILQANDIPPMAQDIASYKNTVLYSNTKYFQSIILTINKVGAGFLTTGSTVTIDGIVFMGVGAAPGNNQFVVFTGGTEGENTAQTAYNLCVAINKSTTLLTIQGHYVGSPDVSPGSFQLVRTALNLGSFVITASSTAVGNSFTPKLPTSGSTVISSDNAQKNAIYVSKRDQPEGVPITNFFLVGSAEHSIDRIVSLSDSVFIFKKDGIFRMTGEIIDNFRVYLYDDTNVLIAPDSAITYNDAVFCFTNQGIMAVTASSPILVSKDIQETILKKVNFTDIDLYTFGMAYETDRKYILFTINNSGDSPANIAFVFDSITQAWTTWAVTARAGFINPEDDKIYLCSDDEFVRKERKSYDDTDYSDDQFDVSITAFDGQFMVTLASVTNVVVGQSLFQTGNKSKITAISGLNLTLSTLAPWAVGAAIVTNAIPVQIKWLPQYANNPGYVKHFQEITFFFRDMQLRPVTMGNTSNFSNIKETIELSGTNSFPWGSGAWGSFPWGGGAVGQQAIRTFFPLEKAYALFAGIFVEHSEAFVRFALNGASLIYENADTRFK
jgi:hypothetical protein